MSAAKEELHFAYTRIYLSSTLALAVPLWITRIVDERWTEARRLAEASRCGGIVASQGDSLMWSTKPKPGRKLSPSDFCAPGELSAPSDIPAVDARTEGTYGVFNALACGLACASFQPGGVKAFGEHFESNPQWLEVPRAD